MRCWLGTLARHSGHSGPFWGKGTDDSCFCTCALLYWVESGGGLSTRADNGQQKKDSHRQKELAIHDIPFSYFCERLSDRKYIIRR